MSRKRLKHYADAVCNMFVGWRVAEDLETLSTLPDGTVSVDLLSGEVSHSEAGLIELDIAKELQAWLRRECTKEGIDMTQLRRGCLVVDIDTSKLATDRKRIVMFEFECRSRLDTDEASYEAVLKGAHRWHTRAAS